MSDTRIPVEELIDFPTDYSFKAIGHHTLDFAQRAWKVAKSVFVDDRPVRYRTRLSRNGTYISATVTVRIESAEELHAVYAALKRLEGLITLL